MAERYLFFNDALGDERVYQASDFAWYFDSVLKTGLIHTDGVPELEVKCDGSDLRTYVVPGRAIINGYGYENTSDLYLTHDTPDSTNDRIDRVVLRLDTRNQSRFIKLFVIKGEPSTTPVPPTLHRDEEIYELSLAQVPVRANTSALNPADIIDERLNEDVCGLVSIQDTGFVRLGDFNDHTNNKNNPHDVTVSQIGAISTSQKGQPNGVATLDSNGDVPASQLNKAPKQYVTGTYTGDGNLSQTIPLGFRPSAVLVTSNLGVMNSISGWFNGGLALDGHDAHVVSIVANGFVAKIDPDESRNTANKDGNIYKYIAWK